MRERTNEHIRTELGKRLRARRLDRNITQANVAEMAGVDRKVVSGIERGRDVSLDSFLSVLRALDLLDRLDELIPAPVPSPIAELMSPSGRRTRQRARPDAASTAQSWSWGDES